MFNIVLKCRIKAVGFQHLATSFKAEQRQSRYEREVKGRNKVLALNKWWGVENHLPAERIVQQKPKS